MFRSIIANRLLIRSIRSNPNPNHPLIAINAVISSHRFSSESTNPSPFAHQNPSPLHQQPESLGRSESPPHEERVFRGGGDQAAAEEECQEEQARVLQAALRHVRLGWSEAAMVSGAKDVGVSPSIVGSFRRKEAALVEYFMDDCLKRLIKLIDSDDELANLLQSDRIVKLVRIRLEMQAPYISKWPQALSIQAQPANIPTSFKQRAMLVDEIWHAAGDQASDIDWYAKRTALGGIYSATEIYMLTDKSPEFRDTWTFLGHRVKDVLDIGKTIQEAKYLAEAVGEGIGNTLQGFVRSIQRR
ncbi:hypothetical protein Sjap_011946 [Stephania japonica]|uniref:Ubiquinone biosynthesis protein n=1 Tax=Stephania japonica TaxID=461633 RepID=A0AAP0JCC4_9MAGN